MDLDVLWVWTLCGGVCPPYSITWSLFSAQNRLFGLFCDCQPLSPDPDCLEPSTSPALFTLVTASGPHHPHPRPQTGTLLGPIRQEVPKDTTLTPGVGLLGGWPDGTKRAVWGSPESLRTSVLIPLSGDTKATFDPE